MAPVAALGLSLGGLAVAPVVMAAPAATTTLSVTNCTTYGTTSTPGTLAAALSQVTSTSTNYDIQFACGGDIIVPATITVSSGITLTMGGNGNTVTLDGNHNVEVLKNSGTLTLQDLTITHGNALNDNGGGIDNLGGGMVRLINSTVSANSADFLGGGIYNGTGSTVTLTNSTLSGNSSRSFPGGGIFSLGTVTLTNSTVSGNTAPPYTSGGGIESDKGGSVTISNSTFTNNTGPDGGGALNTSGAGTVAISNSTFTGNSATGNNGGAIHNINATVTINNSTFTGNTGADGAGIYNAAATMTISNSTFSKNTAANVGGGIYNDTGGTAKISDSAFSGNAAANTGGGVDNIATMTLTNSAFSSNTANNTGGGISNSSGGTATISNSTVSGNTADSYYSSNGGGIYNAAATMTISNSTVSGNTTTNVGGGIFNDTGGTATISNSTFSRNIADNTGGDGAANLAKMTIANSTFSANGAGSSYGIGGGGLLNANGTATISNSTFSGNSAANGGGIVNIGGAVTLSSSTIAGNSGGIYSSNGDSSGKLAMGGNIVAQNTTGDCNIHATTATDLGYNLDGDNTCGFTAAHHDQPGVASPKLGTLANNGGPTQTIALLPGSSAINAIPVGATYSDGSAACPASGTTDQRGVTRPQGNGCDIGAYELRQVVDTEPPQIGYIGAKTADGQTYTLGTWTNQNVTLTWTCTDVGTGVKLPNVVQTVSAEGNNSATGTCTNSTGKTSTNTQSGIKIDKSKPTITFSGNAGSYTVDQTVNITCTAADQSGLSGIDPAKTTCPTASGPAYTFNLGRTTLTATAADNAGNTASQSTSFTVAVTSGSLASVTSGFVTDAGVAAGLNAKLTAAGASLAQGNAHAASGQIRAYIHQVEAQTGKTLTGQQAATLSRLAQAMLA